MNYELAKELKDAGFPFDFGGIINDDTAFPEAPDGNSNFQYSPDLSELIEACGKNFRSLVIQNPTEWVAYDDQGFGGNVGYGSTPEEAVANLWLELNKK